MRKGKHKLKSEHFLIGTIVVSVFLMLGIGYALLSQTQGIRRRRSPFARTYRIFKHLQKQLPLLRAASRQPQSETLPDESGRDCCAGHPRRSRIRV